MSSGLHTEGIYCNGTHAPGYTVDDPWMDYNIKQTRWYRGNDILDSPVSCMGDYKFAVAMDNAYEYGYTTEKVFSGAAAST